MPRVIQFIHPGGEHGQDRPGAKAWNRGDHRRKFLRLGGRSVARLGAPATEDELVFWAEWEPESEVERIANPVPLGPRWMHRPYYVRPSSYHQEGVVLQNTDPFVFGDRFRYTLCRQWRNKTNRPTLLRDLAAGSLILFGSLKAGAFVLDTAFVVTEGVLHDHDSWRNALLHQVSETYADVTLQPTHAWASPAQLRLYAGATDDDPLAGMFSFVPCLPAATATNGFPRPAISLDGYITQSLPMGFKASADVPSDMIEAAWISVVDQVLDAGLYLGVSFDLPPERDL